MNELDAFLNGHKPSLLCDTDDPDDQMTIKKLINYPSVSFKDARILFFQNEELKREFLKRSQGLKLGEREFHRILGITLGYPPKAVDFFCDFRFDPVYEEKSVAFDYYGLFFAGNKDDAQSIAQWLWANIPIPPGPMKVKTDNGKEYCIAPDCAIL